MSIVFCLTQLGAVFAQTREEPFSNFRVTYAEIKKVRVNQVVGETWNKRRESAFSDSTSRRGKQPTIQHSYITQVDRVDNIPASVKEGNEMTLLEIMWVITSFIAFFVGAFLSWVWKETTHRAKERNLMAWDIRAREQQLREAQHQGQSQQTSLAQRSQQLAPLIEQTLKLKQLVEQSPQAKLLQVEKLSPVLHALHRKRNKKINEFTYLIERGGYNWQEEAYQVNYEIDELAEKILEGQTELLLLSPQFTTIEQACQWMEEFVGLVEVEKKKEIERLDGEIKQRQELLETIQIQCQKEEQRRQQLRGEIAALTRKCTQLRREVKQLREQREAEELAVRLREEERHRQQKIEEEQAYLREKARLQKEIEGLERRKQMLERWHEKTAQTLAQVAQDLERLTVLVFQNISFQGEPSEEVKKYVAEVEKGLVEIRKLAKSLQQVGLPQKRVQEIIREKAEDYAETTWMRRTKPFRK